MSYSIEATINKFCRGKSWDEEQEIRQVAAIAQWQASLACRSEGKAASVYTRKVVANAILKSFRYPGSRCVVPITYVPFDETTRTCEAKPEVDRSY